MSFKPTGTRVDPIPHLVPDGTGWAGLTRVGGVHILNLDARQGGFVFDEGRETIERP